MTLCTNESRFLMDRSSTCKKDGCIKDLITRMGQYLLGLPFHRARNMGQPVTVLFLCAEIILEPTAIPCISEQWTHEAAHEGRPDFGTPKVGMAANEGRP